MQGHLETFLAAPREPGEPLVFHALPPPTDAEVHRLTARVVRRLTKVATRYLASRDDVYEDPDDEQATVDHAIDVALRPPVRPQATLPLVGGDADGPAPAKPLCAAMGGYSLHAATTVGEHDREGLERLCRYGLRMPLSQRRLSLLPDGRIRYDLARPWPTPAGVDHLVMEPAAFLRRLAALLPAPYQNLVRYHGCFANRSRWRPHLPAPPTSARSTDEPTSHGCTDATVEAEAEAGVDDPVPEPTPSLRARRMPWARLLRRTLNVDGLDCPRCHAQMTLLALITAPRVVARILSHLRLPDTPPPLAPARGTRVEPELFDGDLDDNLVGHHDLDTATGHASAVPRAPP